RRIAPLYGFVVVDSRQCVERRIGPSVRENELATVGGERAQIRVVGADDRIGALDVGFGVREIVPFVVPRGIAKDEILEELGAERTSLRRRAVVGGGQRLRRNTRDPGWPGVGKRFVAERLARIQ